MSGSLPLQPYLTLAEQINRREIRLNKAGEILALLPELQRDQLDQLSETARIVSLNQPHQGWLICTLAEKKTLLQKYDLFLQSLAAWYSAHAAATLGQPNVVNKSIQHARKGFVLLNEPAWVAACDWIENDLVWAINDLPGAESILVNAYQTLENNQHTDHATHNLLALAQVQVLLNKFDEAEKHYIICEEKFNQMDEKSALLNSYLFHSDLLRRQHRFVDARKMLTRANEILQHNDSNHDRGNWFFYSGMLTLYSSANLDLMEHQFRKAFEIFDSLKVTLWKALSLTYLGITNMEKGKMLKAFKLYQSSQRICEQHNLQNLMAQNLTASGRLMTLIGNPLKGIEQLKRAESIHRKTGFLLSAGIDNVNLGKAYFQAGRYQDSLHTFEAAQDILTGLNEMVNVGLVQMNIANYWINLNNYEAAEEQITSAESNLRCSGQVDSLIKILTLKSKIQYEAGHFEAAITFLQDAHTLAITNKLLPLVALCELNLGDAHLSLHNELLALKYLDSALQKFTNMSMEFEKVACMISKGTCRGRIQQSAAAVRLFLDALKISNQTYKELDWRAHSGLAEYDDPQRSLTHYRNGVRALSEVRSNFWQANLAGIYAEKPKPFIERAIAKAKTNMDVADLAAFIEADKAISLLRQLQTDLNPDYDHDNQEINALASEINSLHEQIHLTAGKAQSIKYQIETKTLSTKVRELSKRYDARMSIAERKRTAIHPSPPAFSLFSQESFREAAMLHHQRLWLALDYYLIGEKILILILSPDGAVVKQIPVNNELLRSLRITQLEPQLRSPSLRDALQRLGERLIPGEVWDRLSEDTLLIISPHRNLHGIPWSALGSTPLVMRAIPLITPSLHCSQALWKRSEIRTQPARHKGLLAGIHEFNGRHPVLDYVPVEIDTITSLDIDQQNTCVAHDVSFSTLNQAIHSDAYTWMHLATHFFSDSSTGRIGGFALKHEEVWLDRIRDLAPLPANLVLSGCRSLYSHMLTSDEQVSISATCFVSGVQNIIGNLWPIKDMAGGFIMQEYYRHFLKQNSAAHALARAQRKAIQQKIELSDWCSYACFGIG